LVYSVEHDIIPHAEVLEKKEAEASAAIRYAAVIGSD
jgi:hypothetical protein